MFVRKRGFAVWLNQLKRARHLRKFGHVHYVSRRMRYAILYVDEARVQDTVLKLNRLNYVKKVEPSFQHELNARYHNSNEREDKENTS